MAPRKRNKQDELNRTYRNADVGRVGQSLRNQGFSQSKKGNTYYTVGGVKYNAATGKPVKNQKKAQAKPAAKPAAKAAASAPKATATTSGGPAPASRPISGGTGGGVSKIHTYKDHGSDLHVGRHKTLAEHRAAVAKAKGGSTEAPKASSSGSGKYSTPEDKSKYVAPNGQPYKGPGYGPDKKVTDKPDNFTKNQVGYTPSTRVDGTRYNAGKAAKNRTGDKNPEVASKAANKYMDEIRKKRLGQSNVF